MKRLLTDARKAGVAVVGGLAEALSLGLLPEPWSKWAAVIVAAATAAGVYGVGNKDRTPAK